MWAGVLSCFDKASSRASKPQVPPNPLPRMMASKPSHYAIPSRFGRVFRIGLPTEPERREYCRRLSARPGYSKKAPPLPTLTSTRSLAP